MFVRAKVDGRSVVGEDLEIMKSFCYRGISRKIKQSRMHTSTLITSSLSACMFGSRTREELPPRGSERKKFLNELVEVETRRST